MAINKKSLDVYKNWKRVSVVINDLNLDPQNVRIDLDDGERSKIDQGSIINDLFDNENAFQILESIVEDGWFVDEIPIVINNGNKHVVIEGNRRISALKVLQNPLLAPRFYAKVKPLSNSVLPIKKINVLLAPNRDDVNNLLANRHTKKTTRPWKPLRQGHFYYSQLSNKISVEDLKNKYKGANVEKYIKMCEVHKIASSYDFGDIETNNKVREQRLFPVSTLERLYDDSRFREHLNFKFDKNGKIKIESSKKRFDEEFKKVVLDAVDKTTDTRKLGTDKLRKKYYSKLDKLRKAGAQTDSSKYIAQPPIKKSRSGTTGLFDRSLVCTINSRGIDRVLKELQLINYRKFPNAAHDLMRSFLEAILKEYLKEKGASTQSRKQGGYIYLNDVLKESEKYFKRRGAHQIRQVVQTIIKDKWSLDSINHNPSVFSTEKKVKDAADQMSDLIKFIFEDCK